MPEPVSDLPVPLLSFSEHGAGIGAAATVLRANATSCPPQAPVPSCPGWTVTDLVAHVGMVHRWCADTLRGVRADPAEHEAAGRAGADLLQWFDDGATELLDVLSKTAPDWDGFFFLKSSPVKRDAWARRQCHETTVHAVDAMSARLGRSPTVAELWFDDALAVDGVDELLTGFLPRRSSTLRSAQPVTVEVVAETPAGDVVWTVRLSQEPPVVERGPGGSVGSGGAGGAGRGAGPDGVVAGAGPDGVVSGGAGGGAGGEAGGGPGLVDARWSAPARDLYLGLWNRTDPDADRIRIEARSAAGQGALDLWRELSRVTWS